MKHECRNIRYRERNQMAIDTTAPQEQVELVGGFYAPIDPSELQDDTSCCQ